MSILRSVLTKVQSLKFSKRLPVAAKQVAPYVAHCVTGVCYWMSDHVSLYIYISYVFVS